MIHNFESIEDTKRSRVPPNSYESLKSKIAVMEPTDGTEEERKSVQLNIPSHGMETATVEEESIYATSRWYQNQRYFPEDVVKRN